MKRARASAGSLRRRWRARNYSGTTGRYAPPTKLTEHYLEGKPTHQIAKETCHSPEAVDHYVLDFARVYFATVQRGMKPAEVAFAIQRPLYLVQEYIKLIEEFALQGKQISDRVGIDIELKHSQIEASPPTGAML